MRISSGISENKITVLTTSPGVHRGGGHTTNQGKPLCLRVKFPYHRVTHSVILLPTPHPPQMRNLNRDVPGLSHLVVTIHNRTLGFFNFYLSVVTTPRPVE